MRNFTLILFFLVPCMLSAVTKTSIANGLWSNPSTWSPAGVPAFTDDIVINTAVSFNQDIANNGALFHVTVLGSLQDMALDTISFGGNYFLNEGYVSAAGFAIGATDSAVNFATITADDFAQSGLMINRTTGIICAGTQLLTSDIFRNDGSITAGMWVNGGLTTGTGGRFCVAGFFINSDQITGTIDICDATPGQMGDFNTGTIATSVTNCQVGPCAQCTLTNVAEIEYSSLVSVTPHPVSSVSVFQFDLPQIGTETISEFIVTDITGRLIKTVSFTGTQFTFERYGMETGVYFYQLVTGSEVVLTGKIMVE